MKLQAHNGVDALEVCKSAQYCRWTLNHDISGTVAEGPILSRLHSGTSCLNELTAPAWSFRRCSCGVDMQESVRPRCVLMPENALEFTGPGRGDGAGSLPYHNHAEWRRSAQDDGARLVCLVY